MTCGLAKGHCVSVFPREIKPHGGYRHEALLWHGLDDFVQRTSAFVLDGVRAGQPVMVAVAEPRLTVLRAALGALSAGVRFVDMGSLGRNPARIIPAWQSFVDECATDGQPVRGVGEPIWSSRSPAELAECQLHEALLDQAIGPEVPLWLVCPYDLEMLESSVIQECSRSHLAACHGSDWADSATYGGRDHAADLFAAALPEPDVPQGRMTFDRHDLSAVRLVVESLAQSVDLPPLTVNDLMLAVHEIASNSVIHGGGAGVLRWWVDSESVVFETRDLGLISDPMVGRVAPSPAGEGGRGLWLVNQLCELVQVRSGGWGTSVRIHQHR